MRLNPRRWLIGFLIVVSGQLTAADSKVEEAITGTLTAARPDLIPATIKESPFAGVYEVQITNGPVVYMSADGKHMIAGDMFELGDSKMVNLTELPRNQQRLELMASIKPEEMIVFSPAKGKTKASIAVFTDVDCGYCQKLHQEVPELNALGIEVKYLAFPRAGVGSASYNKIATAWCAEDPQETLTRLKNREIVEMAVCEDNPVAQQYMLGQQMGVRGTPALVTDDGQLLPGYRPAKELARELGVN